MTDLRTELVQTAAVAMAAIEDLDTGSASRDALARVMTDVALERMAQNRQWGPQHHDPIVWLAILAEEVGEVARTMDPEGTRTYIGGRALVELLTSAEQLARQMLASIAPVPAHDFAGNDNCARCDANPWTRSPCVPDSEVPYDVPSPT